MSLSQKNSCLGFTLLEVLLTIAIMATLSLSGFLLLDGISQAERQQRKQLADLRQLQRAIMVMDRDFQQLIPRTSRDGSTEYPMFSITPNWLASESGRVSFIRGGWNNPQLRFDRANIQLVAYRVNSGVLERLHWKYVDISRQTAPSFTLPLMKAVKSFKIEVFSQGRWLQSWQTPRHLPKAIRLTIRFADKNGFQRIYTP